MQLQVGGKVGVGVYHENYHGSKTQRWRVECWRNGRYRSLRPNFHPVDFHSFVGVTRKSTVMRKREPLHVASGEQETESPRNEVRHTHTHILVRSHPVRPFQTARSRRNPWRGDVAGGARRETQQGMMSLER